MIPKRVWVNLAAFLALFAALTVWAVSNVITLDLVERPYRVTAMFETAPGLRPNVEVVYLGVRVGTIDAVELGDTSVRVDMDIERDARLPDGISAHVRRKSAVGEPYVSLDAPEGYTGGGPYVEPGSGYTIPVTMTSIPLAYGELFVAVDDLVAAIPGEDLGIVVHELAVALEGRGLALRRLLAGGEDLTSTFAARAEMLDALATELTEVAHVIANGSETIGQSFDDVAALTATLAASRADIETLLTEAPEFGAQVLALLDASADDLGCGFEDFGSFVETVGTPEHIAEILRLLTAAGPARDALDSALVEPGDGGADGPYLGGSFGLMVDPPPPSYDPPPGLPTPEPLLGCEPSGAGGVGLGDNDVGPGAAAGAVPGAGEPSVADRPGAATDSFPASTEAPAGSEAFPLAPLLAVFGAALLVALLVATKPWRLLGARRGQDDQDEAA